MRLLGKFACAALCCIFTDAVSTDTRRLRASPQEELPAATATEASGAPAADAPETQADVPAPAPVVAASPAAPAYMPPSLPDLPAEPRLPADAPAAVIQNDQHYLEQTYNFLRSSNDNVGKSIQSMLGVQTNLDILGQDLEQQYKAWSRKKTELLKTRELLTHDVARLQAALEVQAQKRAEKERITTEAVMLRKENNELKAENDRIHQNALIEILKIKDKADELQRFVAKSQDGQVVEVDAARKKTAEVRKRNKLIQQMVFELNQQLKSFEDVRSKNDVNYQKVHQSVLLEIEGTQRTIHEKQTEVIAQAQLQSQTRALREQVVAQANETLRQRQAVVDLQQSCMAQLKKADHDITLAKLDLQDANDDITRCQQLDAEDQQVQAELNHCNLMKKTSR